MVVEAPPPLSIIKSQDDTWQAGLKGGCHGDSDELTLEDFASQVKGRWMNFQADFQVADRPIYRMSW